MGVMECGRLGCEEIMCNKLILEHSRYICWDCWKELLEYKATWNAKEMPAGGVREYILYFMNKTRRGFLEPVTPVQIDIEEEFERLT